MSNMVTVRSRRHCQAGYNFGAVAPWPLQRCSCGFAGDDTSPSTENLACSNTYCSGPKAWRPCHSCFAGVAWLPITERIQYKLWLLVHKMFVGHAPDYIASLLMPASDIPSRSSLRSSSNCDLVVPKTSRKIGDRAFSVAAPRAWNRLPTDLKLLRSTASFKSKLKSFMFHVLTPGTLWTLECAIGLLVGGALQVTTVTVVVT